MSYHEGMKIDKYRVRKYLGDGTFGRVLEVEERKSGKIYALKVI